MALNQTALQKKRAKKSEQRNGTKKRPTSSFANLWSSAREWAAAADAPIADVLVPGSLFQNGMGSIWFSRRLADGRYALSMFLIDAYCLGIKNALYAIVEPDNYARRLEKLRDAYPDYQREHPAYARKLVEQAAAFARDLGFDPHPDCKMARIIFGGVDAAACPVKFSFGREGKPFFISGPDDTPTVQKRVMRQLERRCGAGGFDFLVTADPSW